MRERAIMHIDKAVALALEDKLYGTLTEYIRHSHGLLEERIALIDPSAVEIVKALYATYRVGWSTLSGKIRNRYTATNLTEREREVAKLTAIGFKVSAATPTLPETEYVSPKSPTEPTPYDGVPVTPGKINSQNYRSYFERKY